MSSDKPTVPAKKPRPGLVAIFASRRMAVVFLLGFSSGLPLYLTGQTLQAWLTSEKVSLDTIAVFSTVGLAYTFKFAWAPLLDRFRLRFLGRRRGWMLATQLGLVVAIATMGQLDPVTQPDLLFALAVVVAVLSASQDIVIDAYNTELLSSEQRAAGAAVYVFGYRTAMLVVGTVALYLADYVPWRITYSVVALFILIGVVATLLAEEPPEPERPVRSILQAIYRPFNELVRGLGVKTAIGVLAFVALYKFGDYFAQTLLITFFRRGLGYDFAEIATVYKILGFAGMFIGGLGAGVLVARYGLRKTLFVFGIVQACTNLLYAWLAYEGQNYAIWGTAVLFDNITGSMGTAAFVAFLMTVCTPGATATQYALLTSLSSVGQRVFGPFADDVIVRIDASGVAHLASTSGTIDRTVTPVAEHAVAAFDWSQLAPAGELVAKLSRAFNPRGDAVIIDEQWVTFFVVTALMAIPGLVLAIVVGNRSR